MERMTLRCGQFKEIHPEKAELFDNYLNNQSMVYEVLENELISSIMVLKRI